MTASKAFTFSVAAPAGSGLDVGSNSGVMWGVNGHPMQGGTIYMDPSMSPATQLALVNTLGLKSYRIDFEGIPNAMTVLRTVVDAAKALNIKVFPILMADINTSMLDGYADETAAYNAGKAFSQPFAAAFSDWVKVWELGNEWNGKIGPVSGQGTFASDYNTGYYVKCRGLTKGLIDGIKAGDPTAKCAFGSTDGAAAWGLNDRLWADGVRWDITCEHFYSWNGINDIRSLGLLTGLTDKLALNRDHYKDALGSRPQWMTEFNYYVSTDTIADKNAMGNYLATTMAQYDSFATQYGLEAVHIYEMLDEPYLASQREGSWGLCSTNGALNAAGTSVKNYLASHPSVVYK